MKKSLGNYKKLIDILYPFHKSCEKWNSKKKKKKYHWNHWNLKDKIKARKQAS